MISEDNLRAQLRHPAMMIGTDGEARALTGPMARGLNHPRSFGTFPRVLSEYVRRQQILTFEEAIHKMTGMPADKLRLHDRGYIMKGQAADLVIFDPQAITDLPSYENPYQNNPGIDFVLVNGTCTMEKGKLTGNRPGKRLLASR
jgi:N-acyl-D-aspartate/D-glutamate deacylase